MSTTAFSAVNQQPSNLPFFAYASPERAVLSYLLDQHPRQIAFQELVLEVGQGLRESAVRRAVDNLAAADFVHRKGAVLTPAPAVVSFDREPLATNF